MGLELITNFGLDRNETVWCGYKLRNDSENFGLVRNEFQSETYARVGIHSELIRIILNHSDICIPANANQSEKGFQSHLLKIA